MVRFSGAEAILARALSDLLRSWERTTWAWRDRARAEFEKGYIEQLKPSVRAAQSAMAAVSELLKQVVRECS
jgi:hypothetical protein